MGLRNSRTMIRKQFTQLFTPQTKKKNIKATGDSCCGMVHCKGVIQNKHWLLLVGLTEASLPICAWWKTLPPDINGIKLILSHLRGLLLIFPGFCQGKSVFTASLWITQRKVIYFSLKLSEFYKCLLFGVRSN